MMEGKMAGERFFRFVDGAADEIVLCDATLVAFFKRYGGDDAVARAWVQVSHAFCVAAEGCASRLADAEGARAQESALALRIEAMIARAVEVVRGGESRVIEAVSGGGPLGVRGREADGGRRGEGREAR